VPVPRDRTPSLHVFPTSERWCCFSCGRGGSVYDLSAAMWGMAPRGREFIQIRERLQERFALDVTPSTRARIGALMTKPLTAEQVAEQLDRKLEWSGRRRGRERSRASARPLPPVSRGDD
jgi:hypothetical protein